VQNHHNCTASSPEIVSQGEYRYTNFTKELAGFMRDTLRRDPFWTGGQKVPWMDLRAGRGKKILKNIAAIR